MKILIYRWSVFHQEGYCRSIESFGHTVEYYEEMPDERERDMISEDSKKSLRSTTLFFLQLFFTGV